MHLRSRDQSASRRWLSAKDILWRSVTMRRSEVVEVPISDESLEHYSLQRGAINCWAYLMEHAAIVRGNIAGVHKQAFLHLSHKSAPQSQQGQCHPASQYSHRLKLLTGVDTSTRPVNKSGSEGNRTQSSNRKTKAAPKTAAFLRSTDMANN